MFIARSQFPFVVEFHFLENEESMMLKSKSEKKSYSQPPISPRRRHHQHIDRAKSRSPPRRPMSDQLLMLAKEDHVENGDGPPLIDNNDPYSLNYHPDSKKKKKKNKNNKNTEENQPNPIVELNDLTSNISLGKHRF